MLKVWTQYEYNAALNTSGFYDLGTGDFRNVNFNGRNRVRIGPQSMLGHHVRLGQDCEIGEHCDIGHHFRAGANLQIGKRCRFGRDARTFDAVFEEASRLAASSESSDAQVREGRQLLAALHYVRTQFEWLAPEMQCAAQVAMNI